MIITARKNHQEVFDMGKVAVVYWSGTGNTEEMAKAVLEGAKKGGAEAELFTVSDFSADKMADYNGFLFGCPAMGDEVLEEDEFEPFFTEAEKKLSGVPVGLLVDGVRPVAVRHEDGGCPS